MIAKKIGNNNWKALGKKLNVTSEDLDRIERQSEKKRCANLLKSLFTESDDHNVIILDEIKNAAEAMRKPDAVKIIKKNVKGNRESVFLMYM